MTDCDRIIEHLAHKGGRGATVRELFRFSNSPTRRITDLRRKGHRIEPTTIEIRKAGGKRAHIVVYRLEVKT